MFFGILKRGHSTRTLDKNIYKELCIFSSASQKDGFFHRKGENPDFLYLYLQI